MLWVGGAIFQALPGQNTGTAVAGAISSGAGGAPGWLGRLDASVAGRTTSHGTAVVVALVVSEALIGLAALHWRSRGPAVAAGFVLALAIWVVGQDLGQLYSGHATDPNTAPIIALMAIAILGARRVRVAGQTFQRADQVTLADNRRRDYEPDASDAGGRRPASRRPGGPARA